MKKHRLTIMNLLLMPDAVLEADSEEELSMKVERFVKFHGTTMLTYCTTKYEIIQEPEIETARQQFKEFSLSKRGCLDEAK
jgi:hypothetical protein